MKILTIGDVVARQGCDCLRHILPGLKRELGANLTIVNGENSAIGNGILPGSAQFIFDSGADVITLGNHGLRRREIYPMLEENEFLLRPANYHPSAPGRGSVLLDMGAAQVGIISLQGAAFMEPIANPFDAADREVHRLKEAGAHIILIDFHAEATAEKRALGYYLDGRVSALFGTHTHVQTADEQVLPGGTGRPSASTRRSVADRLRLTGTVSTTPLRAGGTTSTSSASTSASNGSSAGSIEMRFGS